MDDSITLNLSMNVEFNAVQRTKAKRKKTNENKQLQSHTQKTAKAQFKRSYKTTQYEKKVSHRDDEADLQPNLKHVKRNQEGPEGDFKKTKQPQVISSLFTYNPHIPVLQSTNVDRKSEDLFSTEKFSEIGLHPHMVANIEKNLNIDTMTYVQKLTIPHLLKMKDVLVKSQTGSGKTLAYAVPIVQSLQEKQPKLKRSDGPYALVIVPTRELATQSFDTFVKLVKPFTWIVPGYLMGGEKKKSEKARIRKGINILVTTPGRFLDHVRTTLSLNLEHISWLVIDEADRLLDLGFEKDISQIIEALNEKQQVARHTALVSATLTQGVERLAGISLTNPVHVNISSEGSNKSRHNAKSKQQNKDHIENDETFVTPDLLKQYYVIVPSKLRLVTLAAFLLWKCKFNHKPCKMVVFLSTQVGVELHHNVFVNCLNQSTDETEVDHDISIFKLHGDMQQKDRSREYSEFCEAKSAVLLCTDVAARGLDMPHVNWIVQYNPVGSPADYIHRVGRTARAGSQGSSLLMLTPAETEYISVLNKQNISLQEMVIDDILKTLLLDVQKSSKKVSKSQTSEDKATQLQLQFENYILSSEDSLQLAKQAFQSQIRSYTTYPSSLKHIFHVKNLHLGHVAKSFGLRDTPSTIAGLVHHKKSKKRANASVNLSGKADQVSKKRKMFSEFDSGLDLQPEKSASRKKRITKKKKPGK